MDNGLRKHDWTRTGTIVAIIGILVGTIVPIYSDEIREKLGVQKKTGVEKPPSPSSNSPTITFSADPETLDSGQAATLTWRTTSAMFVTIQPGIGKVPPNGSLQVTPLNSQVYTATVTGSDGKASAFASIAINVRVPPVPKETTISFSRLPSGTTIEKSTLLKGTEFIDQGIASMRPAPEDDYCSEARNTMIDVPDSRLNDELRRIGSLPYPSNYLTTVRLGPDSEVNGCNGIPLELVFEFGVRTVDLQFFGALRPYKLTAYDVHGNVLQTESKTPRNVRTLERIGVRVDHPAIAKITFGYKAAMTAITEIAITR